MPWLPELFSGPALERIYDRAAADARAAAPVPYFDGVRSGETEALIGSFAGEPELHHPIRGRVKGRRAFERFMAETNAWLTERNGVCSPVERIITPRRGVEETVVTFDGDQGRIELPMAIAADRDEDARIIELRLYYSTWPFTGRHANRPPVLQPDADLHAPDVVGEYQRALAAGDVQAAVAAFESDAYVREPAGGAYVHRGRDALVAHYERLFSNGGGIPLEHCALTEDGRSCVLEYNVVRWGRTDLAPEAGLAVYVRGDAGKLASARIYDDADPPLNADQ
jgi:SnoaL-like protein